MADKQSKTFHLEPALEELNQLVEKMEAGGLSLDEMLINFEKGVALTRLCQDALKTAEQRVEILLKKNGEESLEPYDEQ